MNLIDLWVAYHAKIESDREKNGISPEWTESLVLVLGGSGRL